MKSRLAVAASACGLSLILLVVMIGCGQGFLADSSSSSTGNRGNALPVPVGPSGGGGNGGGSTGTNEYVYALEFATSPQLGWVEGFGVSSTGALHMVSKVGLSSQKPEDIKIDSQSQYLFTVSSSGCCFQPAIPSQIQSMSISAGGNLGPVGTANTVDNQIDTIHSMLLDQAGRNLYTAGENSISTNGKTGEFTVDRSTGQITSMGPDVVNEYAPGWLVMSPNGLFVYASIEPRHLAVVPGGWFVMTRNPVTGALTDTFNPGFETTPATVYPGPRPGEIYNSGVFVLAGRYLVGGSWDHQVVTVWSADASTGALTPVTEIGADFSSTVSADQSGNFIFVTHQTGVVNSYRVNADGTLTLTGSGSAGAGTGGVLENAIASPSNHFVYVTDGVTPQIWAFTFNATTGALGLVPGSPFTASNVPGRMAVATK